MRWWRLAFLMLIPLLGFGLNACTDEAAQSLLEPQFAKPDGPPGLDKDDPSEPIELKEYYIYRGEDGRNYVHILATGQFPEVNLQVVQDFIFDGIRNDDYDIYYEYTDFSPPSVGPGDFEEGGVAYGGVWEELPDGTWHIDIPWNGETKYQVWDESGSYQIYSTTFPDHPAFALEGSNADPYAFEIRFQTEAGDYLEGVQPQGIILEGAPIGSPEFPGGVSSFHPGMNIYSYAAYESDHGAEPVYIDRIDLDPAAFTCELKTIRERIDGVKITRTVARIYGPASVALGPFDAATDSVPKGWLQVMLAQPTAQGPTYLDSYTTTFDAQAWSVEWGVSATMEDVPSGPVMVQLAVPYVYATNLEIPQVYDPGENNDGNGTIDWYTINDLTPITAPGTWPVALTEPFEVDCGK